MNRRRNRPIGPWHLYVLEPARWVEIKKKDVTGLVSAKKVEFCPHCGDKLSLSRRFGVKVAEVSYEATPGMGRCQGCGQTISVLPYFLKIPGM